FFLYVQWLAFSQWQALKAYGALKQVYLMGDIPYGVGRFSADVWANPDIFDLDWSGGAPPEKTFKVDRFTEKWGQNWGVPDYRWAVLRSRNFDWAHPGRQYPENISSLPHRPCARALPHLFFSLAPRPQCRVPPALGSRSGRKNRRAPARVQTIRR